MGLFKPAWMSKDKGKALKSAEKVTNQTELGRMAKEAVYASVRAAAVEKLTDLNTLAEIAEGDADSSVRFKAFRKLPDKMRSQKMRMDIAMNEDWSSEQEEIIAQLTDRDFLTRIAEKKIKDQDFRAKLYRKLSPADLAKKRLRELALSEVEQTDDQRVLAAIARDENHRAQTEAIMKLTDGTVLEEIAIDDKNGHAGEEAIKRICDQSTLYRIAMNAANGSVAQKAVEKVNDKQVLFDLACSGSDKKIVKKAVNSLQEDQELLYRFLCSCNDYELCGFAVKKLKDEEKLYKIVCGGYMLPVREQALSQLNDQDKIRAVLQNETDPRLKSIACGMTQEGHSISGCACKRCGAIVTCAKHDWECTKHQSYDGSGEAEYVCRKCGLKKHEDWNPYNASERYSHSSRSFV